MIKNKNIYNYIETIIYYKVLVWRFMVWLTIGMQLL